MLAATRSSVWARVLDVLAYHGWRADVYVHGYDPWGEAAPASVTCAGNASTSREVEDVRLAATAPWRLLLPIQADVDEGGPASPLPHVDDDDALLAASLAAVTRMWQAGDVAGDGQYRAVIYARHDLWHFADLHMASLRRVVANPDTVITHDACKMRRQALPDFMLVDARAAERLVKAAGQVRQRRASRRGQCSLLASAADAGLKFRLVEVGRPAYSYVDRSGLPGFHSLPFSPETVKFGRQAPVNPPKHTTPLSSPVVADEFYDKHMQRGSWKMCVNHIGAWDITTV